jgi:hypothetical protein
VAFGVPTAGLLFAVQRLVPAVKPLLVAVQLDLVVMEVAGRLRLAHWA